MASRRDLSIDSLRGMAALLLVAFHCIDTRPTSGGHLGYDYFGYSFGLIRMPLFTVLSGYVYAMRPLEAPGLKAAGVFIAGKTRRLLIPLVSATTAVVLLRRASGHAPEATASAAEFLGFYFFSYEVYWFLQALFWVFLLVVVLERLGLLKRVQTWLAVLVVVTVVSPLLPGVQFFALVMVRYLAPFFLLGLGYRRFETQLRQGWWVPVLAIVAIGLLVVAQLNWWLDLGIPLRRFDPLNYVASLACTFLLLRFRFASRPLARLGGRAYGIYLYHLIGVAIGTRLAGELGFFGDAHPAFFIKLAFGLSLPVLAERVLLRFELTRVAVLGLRRRRPAATQRPAEEEPG